MRHILKWSLCCLWQNTTDTASVERGVAKIKIHIKYSEVTTDYDIALIKLDKPVDLVPNLISPICLPSPFEDFTGSTATVAGTDWCSIL